MNENWYKKSKAWLLNEDNYQYEDLVGLVGYWGEKEVLGLLEPEGDIINTNYDVVVPQGTQLSYPIPLEKLNEIPNGREWQRMVSDYGIPSYPFFLADLISSRGEFSVNGVKYAQVESGRMGLRVGFDKKMMKILPSSVLYRTVEMYGGTGSYSPGNQSRYDSLKVTYLKGSKVYEYRVGKSLNFNKMTYISPGDLRYHATRTQEKRMIEGSPFFDRAIKDLKFFNRLSPF